MNPKDILIYLPDSFQSPRYRNIWFYWTQDFHHDPVERNYPEGWLEWGKITPKRKRLKTKELNKRWKTVETFIREQIEMIASFTEHHEKKGELSEWAHSGLSLNPNPAYCEEKLHWQTVSHGVLMWLIPKYEVLLDSWTRQLVYQNYHWFRMLFQAADDWLHRVCLNCVEFDYLRRHFSFEQFCDALIYQSFATITQIVVCVLFPTFIRDGRPHSQWSDFLMIHFQLCGLDGCRGTIQDSDVEKVITLEFDEAVVDDDIDGFSDLQIDPVVWQARSFFAHPEYYDHHYSGWGYRARIYNLDPNFPQTHDDPDQFLILDCESFGMNEDQEVTHP